MLATYVNKHRQLYGHNHTGSKVVEIQEKRQIWLVDISFCQADLYFYTLTLSTYDVCLIFEISVAVWTMMLPITILMISTIIFVWLRSY